MSGLSVALALASANCKRNPSGPAPQPSSSAVAAVEKAPANADAELWKELSDLTQACKVDDQRGTVTCTQGEQRKLISAFSSGQRSKIKALPTFAAALSSQKPAMQTVGANLLYSALRSSFGADVKTGDVSEKDAGDLLTAALKLPKALARQALPAAVHASMLANQSEALYTALEKLEDPQLRAVAVRNFMVYGRLTAFKKVQELAKDDASHLAPAAVESPQNMLAWTAEEQAAICPWATGLLSDTRPLIAGKAASLLSSCSGEFIDKLLEAGERSLAANKFAVSEVAGYRDLCSANRRGRQSAATEQQCARSRKLLEKVTETKAVDQQARSMALNSLAYQWPDDRTVQLAKRLEKSPDAGLADAARRALQRIEQRKAMAGTAASGMRGPMGLGGAAARPGLASTPGAPTPPPAAPADPASELR
ncbi:MAG TPA: hypothetical protein VG937_22605 [Polyangiaceae bacterium]|nr:hypothetical protein [Polyangiaceae bacterium]